MGRHVRRGAEDSAAREARRRPGERAVRGPVVSRAKVALRLALAALACLAPSWLAGCATPFDVHLAPLYTSVSTAGGGQEVEALFGAIRVRRPAAKEPVDEWALRPLISAGTEPNGDFLARFLVPLGTHRKAGADLVNQLLPVWRYQRTRDVTGRTSFWRIFALPGLLWSQDGTGRIVRAFFPFGGIVEGYLTYDRVVFWLFPLFVKSERAGRTSWNFLFPIFKYAKGPRGRAFRIWPLFGRSYVRGSFDRRFVLWPIFHVAEGRLWAPPEERQHTWMFWPLVGRTRVGSFRATTVLWPFFGWSHDPDTGFWSWDGPWPLVRILRPGEGGGPRRTRFWPLWSNYEGDGLTSNWILWPIFNGRKEVTRSGTRTSQYALPIYQRWVHVASSTNGPDGTEGAPGARTEWSKLWPLYQSKTSPTASRFAFPALNPLWDLPVIDDHYAWLYEILTREVKGTHVKERSWGGLWRREADEHENRSSLTGLWGRRAYQRDGEEVVETSFLFGLLRLRTGGADAGLMRPAFPGPGWPERRTQRPMEGGRP